MNRFIMHTRTTLFFALATLLSPANADAGSTPPNILYIVADDYGYADAGFNGGREIPTPNLDKLAASGIRFSNGYVTQKNCAPTRAALLTGRYQQRFGFEHNPHGKDGLPTNETTVADRLRQAGYATGLIGKWHQGMMPQFHPQARGFDEFYGILDGGTSYTQSKELVRGKEKVPPPAYLTDAFGDEAIAFIKRHQGKPWFLYLAFNAVHVPLNAKESDLARFSHIAEKKRRTYAAMTHCMDENVGKVIQSLADLGLTTNTLVYFISDNGGHTGVGANNAPLRGMKGQLLEGGIRVPFAVAWPGTLKPGLYREPVIHLDLTATALAVAGLKLAPEWKLDGVNLLPYLKGERSGAPHEALYWRAFDQYAVRQGDFKLVRSNMGNERGETKLTGPNLYNLAADLGETNDLSKAMPEKVRELQALWDAWNRQNQPPAWGGGGPE